MHNCHHHLKRSRCTLCPWSPEPCDPSKNIQWYKSKPIIRDGNAEGQGQGKARIRIAEALDGKAQAKAVQGSGLLKFRWQGKGKSNAMVGIVEMPMAKQRQRQRQRQGKAHLTVPECHIKSNRPTQSSRNHLRLVWGASKTFEAEPQKFVNEYIYLLFRRAHTKRKRTTGKSRKPFEVGLR